MARKLAVWLAALMVLAALPSVMPSSFARTVLTFISLYTMVALGLQLLMGYAGQISLGQGAFYGIGAYGYAILTVKYGVPPWPALVAAAIINAAVAYLIGKPILRLSGHQLALATLAFGIILGTIFAQATGLTGGAIGLGGIPNLAIGNFAFKTDLRNAYLTEAFAVGLLLLAHNMMRSRIGRALQALSANENAAASLGVDVAGHKLHVFALSAVFASIAGSLYASYLTYISPDAFTFILSVEILVMASIGGLATVWGAPIGAAAVILIQQFLDSMSKSMPSGTETILESVVYGFILVTIMIFLPEGLTQGLLNLWKKALGPSKRLSLPEPAAAMQPAQADTGD
ncbi:MAG: branched-chain amino acid ABC transporter permease [Chloroflexota bacterium]